MSDAQEFNSAYAQLVSNTNHSSDESARVVGQIFVDVYFEDDSDDVLNIYSSGEGEAYITLIESATCIVLLQRAKFMKRFTQCGVLWLFRLFFPEAEMRRLKEMTNTKI